MRISDGSSDVCSSDLGDREQQLYRGLSGLLKSASLENPKITGQLIDIGPDDVAQSVATKLIEDSLCADTDVRHVRQQRMVIDWPTLDDDETVPGMPWRERGFYLITGGAGGRGLIFTSEIERQVEVATLVLVHRSALPPGPGQKQE